VDNLDYDAEHGTINVDGRDLSAYLIASKVQETFQNQTSSQIAQTLAARHGLIADVTPTTTLVGRYYQIDHEQIGAGDFTRATTEWNLVFILAQYENFDVWVTGSTLNHPLIFSLVVSMW
jgi:phage protein D